MTGAVEIVLEGPGRNALGTALMTRTIAAIEAARGRPLLVTGAGAAFSAGLDLREVAALAPDGMATFLTLLERLFTTLYQHPAPTVALVNGHAIAGGCVLALCCDARVAVADPTAKIGLNETALGVLFPPRTLAIVRARVPARHQDEVLLGAGLYPPERARSLGLVDEVAADAPAAARATLAALAGHPAAAYSRLKRALRGGAPADLASDAVLAAYLDDAVPIWTGDEVRRRIAAVLLRPRG
jgi:enoyl-CoA hydratase/carnithine racemase